MIAAHLRPGQLVILESTTYPGTTDEVVRPILERRGLLAGRDFFLAFSPERVDPGNEKWTTRNVPKVVGGLHAGLHGAGASASTRLGRHGRRGQLARVVAEMVKLLENTFRAVNIGLVNELALMCDRLGIDVWEVVDAAATKPFGFMPFYPGPGLGGHCIPIDPFYLSWKVKEVGFEARFIELAGHVNGAMPHYVVAEDRRRAERPVRRRSAARRCWCWAWPTSATSTTCANRRPSTSWPSCEQRGARLSVPRPVRAGDRCAGLAGRSTSIVGGRSPDALAAADCVVILTDHRVFDYPADRPHAKLVVDSRNAIKTPAPHVFKLGAPAGRG